MFIIREIMHCKPGKVRPMLEKFQAVASLMEDQGVQPFRLMTDVTGEQFWTLVAETEVDSLNTFMEMESNVMASEEFGKAMAGYHDLVENGRREIYQLA